MTAVKGLNFDEAYSLSQVYTEDDIPVRFLHINSLLAAKKAAGRFKDLDDIQKLKKKDK